MNYNTYKYNCGEGKWILDQRYCSDCIVTNDNVYLAKLLIRLRILLQTVTVTIATTIRINMSSPIAKLKGNSVIILSALLGNTVRLVGGSGAGNVLERITSVFNHSPRPRMPQLLL